uniref:Candidate secreted effector n=1 Tax=Meloidogyne incognita TaxID=6306 RepID=A0A914L9W5_MELIC
MKKKEENKKEGKIEEKEGKKGEKDQVNNDKITSNSPQKEKIVSNSIPNSQERDKLWRKIWKSLRKQQKKKLVWQALENRKKHGNIGGNKTENSGNPKKRC